MGRLGHALRHRRRALAAVCAALAFGAGVGAAALTFQPGVSGTVGPGDVSIDSRIARGGTVVELPPLGQLRADSHRGPMSFTVRLDRLDVNRAGRLAGDLASGLDPTTKLRNEMVHDLRPLLVRFAVQTLVVALAGGLLAGLVLPRRRLRYVAATTAGSVGFVAVVGTVALTSFVPASFDQPEFEGTLAAAPDVVRTVQRHIDDVGVVEGRLEALSGRLVDLYRTAEGSAPDVADVTILHVSDLHSNPVGIELVEETAERFEVDAVIDTGDLTSFGAGVEQAVVDRIARIDVPYYVVPGNHDHPTIRRSLAAAGVTVLDPGVIEIGGIRILGVGEPTFTADNRIPRALWDQALDLNAEEVADLVDEERPHVVAVHNPRQLADALGSFDVGLAGHVHRPDLDYEAGSVIAVTGSSGAGGVGALMEDEDVPYQMQLLQFEDRRLVAIDRIEFRGTGGEFRLERILIDFDRVARYPDTEAVPVEFGPLAPFYRVTQTPS